MRTGVPVPPPAPGGFSRPPLERMMLLHQRIQSGKFPNCRKIADELEVSAKTIMRDIEFMRDRLNLPIVYDARAYGFRYSEPVTSFPAVEVSEGEIVALFAAQKALAQYHGTSFEQPLRAAFRKISGSLQERVSFQWEEVDEAISFRGIGQSTADLARFEVVSKAVLRSEELEFEYRKLQSDRYERRRVQPYHLSCIENQWYLFAFDPAREQLRTFVLGRMRAPVNRKIGFRRPADFSIDAHLRGSFGVFAGKGKVGRVELRFDAFAARLVAEREWHPSQQLKTRADGGCDLMLEIDSLEEIERWILGWTGHVVVRKPAELAQRVRHALAAAEAQYAALTDDAPRPKRKGANGTEVPVAPSR